MLGRAGEVERGLMMEELRGRGADKSVNTYRLQRSFKGHGGGSNAYVNKGLERV
jgi:hypothetical protein